MNSLAAFLLRATYGTLIAGHGAQKLFGAFEGPGIKGTSGYMESLELRPGDRWAYLAGLSEFGGGALTALGLLSPIGPLATIGSMGTAIAKVHWGKPIWAASGGAELPLTNIAIATALAVAGPGNLSLDKALKTSLPRWTVIPGLAIVGTALYLSLKDSFPALQSPFQPSKEEAGAELEAGRDAAHSI